MTDVLVCDSEYDLSTQRRHIDALARKGIDGLVLSGLGRDKPYPALLEADFPPGAGVRPDRSLPHRLRGHRRRGTAHHWAARGRKVHAYSSGRAMSRVNSYMSSGEYRPGRTIRPSS